MRYIELAQKSERALKVGLGYTINNTLPSYWDDNGRGWHEQWMNSDYSGVCAACEGIILLSQAKRFITQREYANIINYVYKHNLCIVFDEDAAISFSDEFTINKRNQRDKALNAAYKLAEFLWASSYIEVDRNHELEDKISNRLYSLFDHKQKLFKNTKSDRKGSILATVFSYIALTHSGHVQPELVCVEEFFGEYLDNADKIDDINVDEIVFIIWAVSQNLSTCNRTLIEKCIEFINALFSTQNVKYNPIVRERYNIRTAGIRDSFSINKYFLFVQALETFIKLEYVSNEYIKIVLVEINRISSHIMVNEVYSRDGKRGNVIFWENYQALQLLNDFSATIANRDCKEDEFMIITPKFFIGDDYIVDGKLCVIIMPLKADWSSDIYETYKEAAVNFKVWRSDEEYRDDVIIQTIWEKINRARFVIADCTGKNPNVFYELGIAHTLGKPVFMCSQNREDFPFDIHHIRSFLYGLKPGEIRTLKTEISKFISSL